MFECYADGWVNGKYRHVVIYLYANRVQCREEVAAEFKLVYGTDCEYVATMPVGMNRECA